MIDRLLDAVILWLSAIGTVFCAYKSLIAIDIYYNQSDSYYTPLGLGGALLVFLAGTAFCATVGLWCEIHRLRMDRKKAKRSTTVTASPRLDRPTPCRGNSRRLNAGSASAISP